MGVPRIGLQRHRLRERVFHVKQSRDRWRLAAWFFGLWLIYEVVRPRRKVPRWVR